MKIVEYGAKKINGEKVGDDELIRRFVVLGWEADHGYFGLPGQPSLSNKEYAVAYSTLAAELLSRGYDVEGHTVWKEGREVNNSYYQDYGAEVDAESETAARERREIRLFWVSVALAFFAFFWLIYD